MEDYIITDIRRQRVLIILVAAAIFMINLDYSMLNISLPNVARAFSVKITSISWVPLIYLLVVTGSLLGFGKLGDIKGYKKLFIMGAAVFACGTILSGLSFRISSLLVSRAVQSVGEAMMAPSAIALVTTQLPQESRGKALGIAALSQGLGMAVGPILGGFLNAYAGWRGIFFVNIPIAALVIFFSIRMLSDRQPESTDKRFDIAGAGLIFIALATFLFALNSVFKLGPGNIIIIGCLGVSAIAFTAFILGELHIPYPLLDLKLFRNRDFSLANASVFLTIALFMGLYFLFPFYLEMVRGLAVSKAGSILVIPPLLMMIVSPFSGKFSDSLGARPLCSAGMALGVIGMGMLLFIDKGTSIFFFIACQIMIGVSLGLFMAPNNKLVMASAPADKQGMASGVYKSVLGLGAVIGLAVAPAVLMQGVFSAAKHSGFTMDVVKDHPEILMKGFHGVFVFGAIAAVLALVFSLLAKDPPSKSE